MTEKLRYVGKPSGEFNPGEVYSMVFGVHQGFFELRGPNGSVDKYASLSMLLQFWEPAGMREVEARKAADPLLGN